jgi:hypothetical protein
VKVFLRSHVYYAYIYQIIKHQICTLSIIFHPMVSTQMSAAPEAATRLLNFINASPTPFHVVHNAVSRLEGAGFSKVCCIIIPALFGADGSLYQVREHDKWDLKAGGKYYFTRYVE